MESQSLAVASSIPHAAMNAVLSNRRRHPRFACEGEAEVFVPHGALLFRGKIRDVSLSGCFIETPALNLERGTQVEVYFVARQMQFRVGGHIAVLRRKRGAGIAFQNLGPRRTRQITELLAELNKLPEPQEPATDA
ncbi:MAG: PilZ domain-containing protein [Acidobacteriaceae bacterium]